MRQNQVFSLGTQTPERRAGKSLTKGAVAPSVDVLTLRQHWALHLRCHTSSDPHNNPKGWDCCYYPSLELRTCFRPDVGSLIRKGAYSRETGMGGCRGGNGPGGALQGAVSGAKVTLKRRRAARRVNPWLPLLHPSCFQISSDSWSERHPGSPRSTSSCLLHSTLILPCFELTLP